MIRGFRAEDAAALREIYRKRGMAEYFPDLSNPLFVTKVVLTDEDDTARMAIAVRLEGNAYTFVDPQWANAQQRWNDFQLVHDTAKILAAERGLDSIFAQVPPSLDRQFGKRLMKLGWEKALWSTYGIRIG